MSVYVIGDPHGDGPVKIGTANDPWVRLKDIRTGGCVTPTSVTLQTVTVLYQYPGTRVLEAELHDHLRRWRLEGEWFDLSPTAAPDVVAGYLSSRNSVERAYKRGVGCACFVCDFEHRDDGRPEDRAELAEADANGNNAFFDIVHALTHARLKVDLCDSHVTLPASHCDIDRAVNLTQVLDRSKSLD
jgi:hypothetical protein